MLLQKPALATQIDAELVDFCRQELRDGLTLPEKIICIMQRINHIPT